MSKKLGLEDIRRVIARNRGAASELARDLDVSPVTIYKVLNGLTISGRVMIAAEERARLLLDENEIHV